MNFILIILFLLFIILIAGLIYYFLFYKKQVENKVFGDWTMCSSQCGGGTQTRTNLNDPNNIETRVCNETPCTACENYDPLKKNMTKECYAYLWGKHGCKTDLNNVLPNYLQSRVDWINNNNIPMDQIINDIVQQTNGFTDFSNEFCLNDVCATPITVTEKLPSGETITRTRYSDKCLSKIWTNTGCTTNINTLDNEYYKTVPLETIKTDMGFFYKYAKEGTPDQDPTKQAFYSKLCFNT